MTEIIFRRALIIEARNEEGETVALRLTQTWFLDEAAAEDRYGDRFVQLVDESPLTIKY